MLGDVEYFQSRLGKIDGFDDAGDYLIKVIKSKEVTAPEPAPAPAPATSPATAPATAPAPTPSPPAAGEGDDGKKSAEESAGLQAQAAAKVPEKNGDVSDDTKA